MSFNSLTTINIPQFEYRICFRCNSIFRCDIVLFKSEETSISNQFLLSGKATTLTHDFKTMWDERKFANFVVVCGDKQFRCHKNILAYRSDVFKAMLSHKNSLEAMTNKVRIDDCEPKVMEIFLEFLYTDQLEDPAGKIAITVQRVKLTSSFYFSCIYRQSPTFLSLTKSLF